LTTLVFALPDGSPLQRTGLLPSIVVPFVGTTSESESSLLGAPTAFRGPDVRDRRRLAEFAARAPWPAPGKGDIGPCNDEYLCRSLRALGAAAARRAAKR
jgi:carboxyl-terminal processing protease